MVHFDPGRILGQQPETPCSVPREHGKSRRAGFPSGKHIRGSRSERLGQLRQRLFVRHSQVMQFDPGHQLIRIVTVGSKSEILFYALDIRDISHGIQLFGDQTRRGDMRQRLQLLVSAGHKNFTDYRNAAFGAKLHRIFKPDIHRPAQLYFRYVGMQKHPEVPSRKRRNAGIDLSRGNFPRFPPDHPVRTHFGPGSGQSL